MNNGEWRMENGELRSTISVALGNLLIRNFRMSPQLLNELIFQ